LTYLLLLGPLIGGILYRMRGGWPDIPRPIEQMLFCTVFLWLMSDLPWYEWKQFSLWGHVFWIPLSVKILAYVLSVIATVKGHGRLMSLFSRKEGAKPEWFEWCIAPLDGKIPIYWYNVLGMSISGLTITIAPALALLTYGHLSGILIAALGLLKGLAYMIGWKLHPNHNDGPQISIGKFTLNEATEVGEFLTGFFIWLAILTKWKKK